MHTLRKVFAAAAAGTAAVAVPVGVAAASTTPGTTLHGLTTVTLAPATARALLQSEILALPKFPAFELPAYASGPTVAASFPVTGGTVDLSGPSGTIDHAGGLVFADLATRSSVAVQDFDIDLGAGDITADIPALGTRAPVFDVSLSGAKVTKLPGNRVDVSNVSVTLTATAAAALDKALSTTLFSGGLPVGTANVYLHTT